MNLHEMFVKIISQYISDESDIAVLWNELESAYQQAFRKYHNLNHLEELFTHYNTHKNSIVHAEEMILAIFYHDYVYSIWKKDNEEKSAVKAAEILE